MKPGGESMICNPWELDVSLMHRLAQTPQNPRYHGEGDVLTHTRMVEACLTELEEYRALPGAQQELLWTAAVLHDIGKARVTRLEEGRWTSPNHTAVGAMMARQLLWQDRGLSGTPEKRNFREGVCALIRYHSLPAHAIDREDGKRRLMKVAALGELIPGFTIRLLCILAKADALGRLCEDREELLERVELCQALAEEAGCLDGPYPFPSEHTRFLYLNGRYPLADQPLYDDTWGPVILMSGLPGTGKDTFIAANYPDLPVVSLDQIRRELGISPEDHQMPVVEEANRRAKELLRRRQPFVWNATNLSPRIRQRIIGLMTDYKAAVRIEFLETSWQEGLRRNRSRREEVPEGAICRMMESLVPPEPGEAHCVRWHCV